MIVALAGGVGGAKLAEGLYGVLPAGELTVIVNTADDFVLHGLHISPDLDTVMYTLAGLANPVTGWGLHGDTFQGLEMLQRYGAPDWFRLGDRDFVTHILRTQALATGQSLTAVTVRLAAALGIRAGLLPMCDEPVRTLVRTPAGELGFQEYFVQRQARDEVLGITLAGVEHATISTEVREAIGSCGAIVLCPSNPFVSIGPILAVPGMRELIRGAGVPLVAVSPIIAGEAVKGPAARMLRSLGQDASAVGVAALYAGMNLTLLIDEQDRALADAVAAHGLRPIVAPIFMRSPADRRQLAHVVLEAAGVAAAADQARTPRQDGAGGPS
jgi:LPPG:FO 2-phospho-L-lactate transferase